MTKKEQCGMGGILEDPGFPNSGAVVENHGQGPGLYHGPELENWLPLGSEG